MAGDDEMPDTNTDQTLLVSCCSSKRRKTETPSSSSSSELTSLCLNDLRLHLIEEILQRLSSSKSVFLCKCVCKNWYSLISSPCFAHNFITHHFNHQNKQNPSALIINCHYRLSGYRLFTVSEEPVFKSHGFELSYLPERNFSVMVSAIFNDLMLCSVYKFGTWKYYICNPITLQWVALPLFSHDVINIFYNRVGFVCEPYYSQDSKGKYTINCNYRFRVVHFSRISTDMKQLILDTYCSETSKWHRSVLEGSEYETLHTDVVAYNQKLLWYNGKRIFAYDPFNPELSTFIDWSFPFDVAHHRLGLYDNQTFQLCQGSLWFLQFTYCDLKETLIIWKLKDYTTWEWSLERKSYLDAVIPGSSSVQQIVNDRILDDLPKFFRPLGFHPSDLDIVYLGNYNGVVMSYNIQTTELNLVDDVPIQGNLVGKIFCMELPLWPTSMPKTDGTLPVLC